jgi:holo-[acyl-carrier protein] synthase
LGLSVGVDLIEIDRVEKALARYGERFLRRIFLDGERDYCMGKRRPAPSLAARFAAKEAFFKAAAPLAPRGGRLRLRWKQAEVYRSPSGAPALNLTGSYRDITDGKKVSLSLTHSKTHAIAVVTIAP